MMCNPLMCEFNDMTGFKQAIVVSDIYICTNYYSILKTVCVNPYIIMLLNWIT